MDSQRYGHGTQLNQKNKSVDPRLYCLQFMDPDAMTENLKPQKPKENVVSLIKIRQ